MQDRRILCLDVGDKRIGLAITDPAGKIAFPLSVIHRQTFVKDCEAVFNLVQEKEAAQIVVGLPLDLNDQEGPQAKKVRFFAQGLQKFLDEKKYGVTITFWEESFSSRGAHDILIEADLGRQKRKKAVDKVAAALILQSYLDTNEK